MKNDGQSRISTLVKIRKSSPPVKTFYQLTSEKKVIQNQLLTELGQLSLR